MDFEKPPWWVFFSTDIPSSRPPEYEKNNEKILSLLVSEIRPFQNRPKFRRVPKVGVRGIFFEISKFFASFLFSGSKGGPQRRLLPFERHVHGEYSPSYKPSKKVVGGSISRKNVRDGFFFLSQCSAGIYDFIGFGRLRPAPAVSALQVPQRVLHANIPYGSG